MNKNSYLKYKAFAIDKVLALIYFNKYSSVQYLFSILPYPKLVVASKSMLELASSYYCLRKKYNKLNYNYEKRKLDTIILLPLSLERKILCLSNIKFLDNYYL